MQQVPPILTLTRLPQQLLILTLTRLPQTLMQHLTQATASTAKTMQPQRILGRQR